MDFLCQLVFFDYIRLLIHLPQLHCDDMLLAGGPRAEAVVRATDSLPAGLPRGLEQIHLNSGFRGKEGIIL